MAVAPTDYYVDGSSGSDSNTGLSLGQAWLTIDKAVTTAPADSVVHVQAGTYANFSRNAAALRQVGKTIIRAADGASVTIQGMTLGSPFTLTNKVWGVTFSGIDFSGSVTVQNCRRIEFVECRMVDGHSLTINDGTNIGAVDRCQWLNPNDRKATNGFGVSSPNLLHFPCDIRIRRSNVQRCWSAGIRVGGYDNCIVTDNEVSDIRFDGINHTDGFRTLGGRRLRLLRNFLHDMAATPLLIGRDGTIHDTVIADNICVRTQLTPVTFNVCYRIAYYNNTTDSTMLWDVGGEGREVVAFNNVMASHSVAGGVTVDFAYRDYNMVATRPGGSLSADTHDIVGTPTYVHGGGTYAAPAGNDYRLRTGTAAIDAGTLTGYKTVVPATLDQRRRPRVVGPVPDMGALEWQSIKDGRPGVGILRPNPHGSFTFVGRSGLNL